MLILNKYMKYTFFIFFTALLLPLFIHGQSDLQDLFDTNFLKNRNNVQQLLINKHNFKKVYFKTNDDITLCGLFLDQSNHTKQMPIQGTIIFDTGFYPGTKEGITTFYALLVNQPYNFLFFDSRGHHESSGSFLTYNALKQYGSIEYHDVIAAINFIQNYNKLNNIPPYIILHGICAGAFHNIKAANRSTHKEYIKGIIFDSGWNKVSEVVEPVMHTEIHNFFQNSYFSFLENYLKKIISYFYNLCFQSHHEKIEPLSDDIKCLTCPILFIHSKQDTYAPIQPTILLSQIAQRSENWWLDTPGHATCHLKHQAEYQEKIQKFCQKCFNVF